MFKVFKERLPLIGRTLSLVLLIGTIAVIVAAFIRMRRQPRPPAAVRAESALKANVTSVVEGYKYVKTENGRETLRLLAAKDIAYEDGRHELEKVDLTAFGDPKKGGEGKSMRIIADRGSWLGDQSIGTFEGNVRVTSSEGLEVTTQSLKFDQKNEIASTDVPVQFKQADLSGSSTGALLYTKTRNLDLIKDAVIVSANPDPNKKGGPPVEIRGDRAVYAEADGVARFLGNVNVTAGEKSARADMITGVVNVKTKKLDRVELRGNSQLKSQEKGKASEMTARDMDFHFDEAQHMKLAAANGAARAVSLEKDAPREIRAERIDAAYKPGEPGKKESALQSVVTQGRTTMKIEVKEGDPKLNETTERVLEADGVQADFREDGKNMLRATAAGNALLTITPKKVTPKSEKKMMRASKFVAEFYETGNAIKSLEADGSAMAEIEPMHKESKSTKKTLSGRTLTSNLSRETQDVVDLTVDGDAKFSDADRRGSSSKAVYTAINQMVALRGKPLVWDSSSRANADEIDANLETGESVLRGRVRTTYYSRETTGGAAPFKNKRGPVTIVSDRADVKHREGAARYVGNARAWQDDDFVRSDNLELDKGEKMMTAWGNAQSAFYDNQREPDKATEKTKTAAPQNNNNKDKARKDIIPVFASADRIIYRDATRTAHYEGSVKIRQGSDRIEAAAADAIMDEENRLVQMTATKNVVMTQPARRATGDQIVYTAANDTAVLTGNLAMVEDRENSAVTKSAKLTLHLHDARIEANDESGAKKRVKTTHRIQN